MKKIMIVGLLIVGMNSAVLQGYTYTFVRQCKGVCDKPVNITVLNSENTQIHNVKLEANSANEVTLGNRSYNKVIKNILISSGPDLVASISDKDMLSAEDILWTIGDCSDKSCTVQQCQLTSKSGKTQTTCKLIPVQK